METTKKWWAMKMLIKFYDQLQYNGWHQEIDSIFIFGEISRISDSLQKEFLSFYHSAYCVECEYEIEGIEKCNHQNFFSECMKNKQIQSFSKNAGRIDFSSLNDGYAHIELYSLNNDGTTNSEEEEKIAFQLSTNLQKLII